MFYYSNQFALSTAICDSHWQEKYALLSLFSWTIDNQNYNCQYNVSFFLLLFCRLHYFFCNIFIPQKVLFLLLIYTYVYPKKYLMHTHIHTHIHIHTYVYIHTYTYVWTFDIIPTPTNKCLTCIFQVIISIQLHWILLMH